VAHHSLHAAEADAVALGQHAMRGARMAISKEFEGDLLAEAINQPPTIAVPASRRI
jgi:hypothetical protein